MLSPAPESGRIDRDHWLPPLSFAQRPWLGADGAPLPFQTDERILDFLNTAEFSSTEPIPTDATNRHRVLLDKGGAQVHARFKDVDYWQERVRLSDGTYIIELRDYYKFEYAAYQMSLLLGVDNVPPTVIRRSDGEDVGSLQIWVEEAMTEIERREQGLRPEDKISWIRQWQTVQLFDILIGNLDRNPGSIVVDSDWKLWLIDHSYSFAVRYEPRNMENIFLCERGVWERLQALDERRIDRRLGDTLTERQISAMLDRRDMLVAHIQALIAERTENAVLYDRP